MMTQNDVEKAIYKKVDEFTGIPNKYLRIENQPTADGKPFVAPTNAAWCAVSIQYGSSTTSTFLIDMSAISIVVPAP